MVEEKEPKGITRRQFLKGITALGASALLSACGVKEKPSGEEPTKAPSPTEKVPPTQTPVKTKEPTLILSPEFSPTPEIISIAGTTITADYLRNAFAGIGGEEVVTNGQEEVSLVQFGQDYVSSSWGEEVDFAKLSEDPISSLKYLISLGTYQGKEGVFTPGKQGEEIIFPQLKDLSLPRLTLEKIPSEGEQKEQEYPERVSPQGLLLRPQTQMTVVGLLNQPKSAEEIIVDKEVAAGELNFALVSFTDYLRSSEEGVPRHYLAVLPTHLPADSDNKNALTLKNLLETNGYQYDFEANELTLVDPQTKEQTKVGLNRIEGEGLIKDLRQATGLVFVDQMNDKLIKNPVVPYPDQMPAIWELSKQEDEEGKISLLLQEQNEQGELVPYAQASYDEERQEWRWEKIGSDEIRENDFVGVSEISPEMLQNCIDQGYICIPLPCHPEGVKEAEFLPYYKGPDPKDESKQIEVGLFGIDLKPGAIVVAPFDGEMSWWQSRESDSVGWDCYRMFLRTELPSGQVIDLDFYPGEIEIIAPESLRASGAVFPLHPVSAGTPLFRYIGGVGHEANPEITESRFFYNQEGPGFIKKKITQGLMIEGWFGFPEERDRGYYPQQIKLATNEEGKQVYILPKK